MKEESFGSCDNLYLAISAISVLVNQYVTSCRCCLQVIELCMSC